MLAIRNVWVVIFAAIISATAGCGGGSGSSGASANSGLSFKAQTGVEPNQLITSNEVTVKGLGTGNTVPVTADAFTTIIQNGTTTSGTTTVKDGDTIALRVTSLGYGLTNTSTIRVSSTTAIWLVTTKPVGGTIQSLTGSGLVLQNNGGESINVPAGSTSFSFNATVGNVAGYDITVITQPANPAQICGVINGVDQVGTALSNVTVVCHDEVAPGTCTSCHGVSATGMPVSHVSNSLSCDQCHITTSWLFTIKPVNHIPYNDGVTCSDCHTGNALVNANVLHVYSVAYTCATCHIAPNNYAGNNQVTKSLHNGSSGNNCVNCHNIAASFQAWL